MYLYFALHQMDKGNVKRMLVKLRCWKSARRKTSVFTMILSQSISLHDKALPPGAIACWHDSIGADDLTLSLLFFKGRELF